MTNSVVLHRSRCTRVGAVGVAAACVLFAAAAPVARATPGVPDAPVALFTEQFENVAGAAAENIDDYAGPGSETYSADTAWTGNTEICNGWVVSFNGAGAGCPVPGDANLKSLARKLGTFAGAAAPDDNHAIGEHRDAGAGDVELEFAEGVEIPAADGAFLVGGIDVAVLDCAVGAPLFSWTITNIDPPRPDVSLSPAPQDACLQGGDLGDGMRGGRIYSDASVLSDFTAMNVELSNANDSAQASSYHALDNYVVADASPKLDQAFDSPAVTTGTSTSLIFTVTNTTDLASKDGWSFSGQLPGGLTVSSGGTVGFARATRATGCPSATVTAPVGGTAFSATGSLGAGQVSCSVAIGVSAASAGSYAISGASLTRVGLRAPGNTGVTFVAPAAAPPPPPATAPACSDGVDNDGDRLTDANDPGCILAGVYVPQKDSEASIAPLAQCSARALQLTDVYGSDGRTVLRGVAGPDHVGKAVSIVATWDDDKVVAKAVVKGDLSFATTAKLPPAAIRNTNAARYQARLENKRSLRLKFARRMTETVASRLGTSRVRIRGRVTQPLAAPRARIVVRAAPSCQSSLRFRGLVVARDVRVARNGAWSATISLPATLSGADKVYLRGSTQVRKTTLSPRTFETFTLIQGVALR